MRVWILLLLLAVVCDFKYTARKTEKTNPKKNDESPEADSPEKDLLDVVEDAGKEELLPFKRTKIDKEELKKDKKLLEGDGLKKKVPNLDTHEFFDIERFHRIEKLKEKIYRSTDQKEIAELKNAKKLAEAEIIDDGTDEQYEACTAEKDNNRRENELCHCDGDEIDCSRIVLISDDPQLRTANLVIVKREFIPIIANFSENGIPRLEEGKILPGFEKTVSVLDLSHNEIRFIDTSAFAEFKNLSRLNLGSNNLQQIKKKWFYGIEKTLHRLDLSHNKIREIPDNVFDELINLKKLILDGNQITDWNKNQFKGLENLEELSLDNCNIENLPGDLFDNLPKLHGISLRSNPLEEIPAATLNQKTLTILDLSETSIPEIRSESFGTDNNLEEIIMENMKHLTSIRDCAFCGLPKLKSLVLANNAKLLELHQNAFGFISSTPGKKSASLTELHLQNGNISTISEQMLEFEKLESFRIGGNPWNCTCETKFLMDSKIFEYKQDSSFPKCASPKELKDRNLATLHTYEACARVRNEHRTGRLSTILGLVLLTSFVSVGIYYGITSGKFRTLLRKAQNVPEVSYSNLTNRSEDVMTLESDFEPRAAVV